MSYRVLITGVAGFIGSHVAEHCLSKGWKVVGVDDLSGGKTENIPKGVVFLNLDVCSQQQIELLFQGFDFDAVYHLAAYAAEGLSHFIRGYNYTNNLIGTTNIINECVKQGGRTGKLPHLVFTSSIAVYGHPEHLPVTEEMTPNPCDPYGIAKYACELDIKAANKMWGLPYTIFRPYNVYGERQNLSDPYRNVVGIFLRQAIQGQPLTIFGDGTQTRAFSHIDDVAPCIADAPIVAAMKDETFNVGGDTPFSVNVLACQIMDALDKGLVVERLPERNEVKFVYASPEKLRSVYVRPDPVLLSEGIGRMALWAKGQVIDEPKPFANIEIDWKLPPSWEKLRTGSQVRR